MSGMRIRMRRFIGRFLTKLNCQADLRALPRGPLGIWGRAELAMVEFNLQNAWPARARARVAADVLVPTWWGAFLRRGQASGRLD